MIHQARSSLFFPFNNEFTRILKFLRFLSKVYIKIICFQIIGFFIPLNKFFCGDTIFFFQMKTPLFTEKLWCIYKSKFEKIVSESFNFIHQE